VICPIWVLKVYGKSPYGRGSDPQIPDRRVFFCFFFVEKLSKSYLKIVKKLSKSCLKVVKKLVKILKRVGGGGREEEEDGDL
jgi:hypothetical protein